MTQCNIVIKFVISVQDATIQTDTPLMSEDDNTSGADDSAFSSNVIINHQPSLTEELNISVPTSTSHTDQCHITNISDTSTDLSSPCNITSPHPVYRTCHNEAINSSMARTEFTVKSHSVSTGMSPRKSTDTYYETAVTSTNMFEEERDVVRRCRSKVSSQSSSPLYDAEPTDLSLSAMLQKDNNNRSSQQNQEKAPATPTPTPDISGLELLSNSIEAFEKKAFIKQEPKEKAPSPIVFDEPQLASVENEPVDQCEPSPVATEEPQQPEFVESAQSLGGLNLLCALAEQRFQEEVGHRSDRKRSSSSDVSEPKRKKHKDKHASKKSKKRDRKEKRRRGSHLPMEGDGRDLVVDELLEKDLKDTYERVKNKYVKCNCKRGEAVDENCHCRATTSWPTAEEVYSAMRSDMRNRLAEISREVQEKKRKLDALSNKETRRHRESTPSSSKSSSSSSKITASLPTLSPSVLSTSSLDCNQNSGADCAPTTKVLSDTDSCSSASSKPKPDVDLTTKKNTSLVGYIFASKKRQNDGNISTADETSVNSDISATLKRVAAIKQETFEFEDSSSQPESTSNIFGPVVADEPAMGISTQHIFGGSLFGTKEHKRKHCSSPKHHKKTKGSKERKHHRRSSEMRERRRVVDEKCTLTAEHLDNLLTKSKLRVLTPREGLFYAGTLTAVQPPDVYAVYQDGERANRPMILSREEILRDAILEISPKSADEVPPTTRLCAYWSGQYRCLYPGVAATSGTPDHERDPKYVTVEFDDGDSGRINLDHIRFLISNYPIDEHPNPLLTLGKKKPRPFHVTNADQVLTKDTFSVAEPSTSSNYFSIEHEEKRQMTLEEREAHRERRRLKKLRKDKLRQQQLQNTDDPIAKRHKHKHKCGDDLCKHRKHKKRRKHKKHHREMMAATDSPSTSSIKKESNEEEDEEEPITGHRQSKRGTQHFDERLKTSAIVVLNTNDCKMNVERKRAIHRPLIKQEIIGDEDMVSSLTEDSSGSSYVSFKDRSFL